MRECKQRRDDKDEKLDDKVATEGANPQESSLLNLIHKCICQKVKKYILIKCNDNSCIIRVIIMITKSLSPSFVSGQYLLARKIAAGQRELWNEKKGKKERSDAPAAFITHFVRLLTQRGSTRLYLALNIVHRSFVLTRVRVIVISRLRDQPLLDQPVPFFVLDGQVCEQR